MHVLSVHAQTHDLGSTVTSFGLRAAPGYATAFPSHLRVRGFGMFCRLIRCSR